jgi:hypothetical protein
MEFFGIFQFITIKKTYGSDYRPIDHLVQTDSTFLTFEKIVLNFLIFVGQRLFAKKSGKNKLKIFHFVVTAGITRHFEERSCPSSSWLKQAIVVLSTYTFQLKTRTSYLYA